MPALKGLSRDPKMKAIIAALTSEFAPTRLFLFGSRANGTNRADSDYDFVVVVRRRRGDRVDNMIRARKVLAPLGVVADVFVYSEKEFEVWKEEFSSIPETAFTTGLEVSIG